MRALEFDILMALLIRVLCTSATITRPSFSCSCIKAKTDLFPMLGAPGDTVEIVSHKEQQLG